MLAFQTPPLERLFRGTLVYLLLFFLIRLVLQRETGSVKITNVLVVVLVADAVQGAMIADSTSLGDGILLVGVILLWAYSLDWLGYRVPAIQRWVHPPPLLLVKDGRMLPANLRAELLTRGELMNAIRTAGLERVDQVKMAYLEGDGQFSVIPFAPPEQERAPGPDRRR